MWGQIIAVISAVQCTQEILTLNEQGLQIVMFPVGYTV